MENSAPVVVTPKTLALSNRKLYPAINLMGKIRTGHLRTRLKKTASGGSFAGVYAQALQKLAQTPAVQQTPLQQQLLQMHEPVRDALYQAVVRASPPYPTDPQQIASAAQELRQSIPAGEQLAYEIQVANEIGAGASAQLLSRLSSPDGAKGVAHEFLTYMPALRETAGELGVSAGANLLDLATGSNRALAMGAQGADALNAALGVGARGSNQQALLAEVESGQALPAGLIADQPAAKAYAEGLQRQMIGEARAMGLQAQIGAMESTGQPIPPALEQQFSAAAVESAQGWISAADVAASDSRYDTPQSLTDIGTSMARNSLTRLATAQSPGITAALGATMSLATGATDGSLEGDLGRTAVNTGVNYLADRLVGSRLARPVATAAPAAGTAGRAAAADAGSWLRRTGKAVRRASMVTPWGLAAAAGTEAAMPSLQQGAERLANAAYLPAAERQNIANERMASDAYWDERRRDGGSLHGALGYVFGGRMANDVMDYVGGAVHGQGAADARQAGREQAAEDKLRYEARGFIARMADRGMMPEQALGIYRRMKQNPNPAPVEENLLRRSLTGSDPSAKITPEQWSVANDLVRAYPELLQNGGASLRQIMRDPAALEAWNPRSINPEFKSFAGEGAQANLDSLRRSLSTQRAAAYAARHADQYQAQLAQKATAERAQREAATRDIQAGRAKNPAEVERRRQIAAHETDRAARSAAHKAQVAAAREALTARRQTTQLPAYGTQGGGHDINAWASKMRKSVSDSRSRTADAVAQAKNWDTMPVNPSAAVPGASKRA